ncbi:MAG: PKD domain-containing protein, partial [Anaerolineales bacterium]|nr:PKD domain-containing protein [Anaerolineales bacterium]
MSKRNSILLACLLAFLALTILAMDTRRAFANEPPVADANGPYSGTEGEEISFDGSASDDPNGTIVSYLWEFGDGGTSLEQNPVHPYSQDGTYTVTLTVTDNESATDTDTTTATVIDTDPIANFTGSPTHGSEPLTVSFTDTSESYDGIVSYLWDFGDEGTSTEQNPVHTYVSAGQYTVSLTVSEADGDSDTKTKFPYIMVEDSVPTASFTYSPPSPLEGDPVAFDASSSTGYDQPLSYGWDFGDGSSGEGVSPTHTYAQDGDYLVTLTVTDADGDSDSTSLTITVIDKDPTADFDASP